MELNKFNYMLEIDILRNSLQKNLSVLRDECPKDAKTPGGLDYGGILWQGMNIFLNNLPVRIMILWYQWEHLN